MKLRALLILILVLALMGAGVLFWFSKGKAGSKDPARTVRASEDSNPEPLSSESPLSEEAPHVGPSSSANLLPGNTLNAATTFKPARSLPPLPAASINPVTPIDVTRIQNEINEVIELNEKLRNRHRDNLGDIQRIAEQARVHQQILKNLEMSQGAASRADIAEEALRQEKIRLIQSQTQQNKQFVENLDKKPAVQTVAAPAPSTNKDQTQESSKQATGKASSAKKTSEEETSDEEPVLEENEWDFQDQEDNPYFSSVKEESDSSR